MIKGSNQEEDITVINIYTANIGACKCVMQFLMDIKGKIHIYNNYKYFNINENMALIPHDTRLM